ncbi:hypothetical protein [Buttiauxella sp. B2]|uniref:hypothetical protein n=1 Tax=Buttiauxella sp. B2 TaxID=2587812 RepID=UPI001CB8C070|nr:hypothetical protein [Buttiauxella sp. B2]
MKQWSSCYIPLSREQERDYHKIMMEQSVPLHRAAGIDIVSFGNSLDDPDAYCLIRAFEDLPQLKNAQMDFYSSEEWRSGPRQSIPGVITGLGNDAI